MRNAFIKSLTKLAAVNKDIVLLTGDLGYTVFEDFKAAYPTRFFNMGVAESNMMGVACGMAQSGLCPIVYSIATFATMRTFEQIRTDVCVHNANVKIVGSGAGLSYGHAGSTHHSLEDIALMRILPNMIVVCLSDSTLTDAALPQILAHKGPVYLRLGKKGEPLIYTSKPTFKIGKAIRIKNGTHVTIIATGTLVYNALCAAYILEKKGINASIIDMHTIKPIDKNILRESIKQNRFLFTVEEHFITGGLGSAVAEFISGQEKHALLHRIGIGDNFIHDVGSQQYLRDINRLTPEKIAHDIAKVYKKYV